MSGRHPLGRHPLGRHLPWADTPPGQTPPGQTPPPTHIPWIDTPPPEKTPPQADIPWEAGSIPPHPHQARSTLPSRKQETHPPTPTPMATAADGTHPIGMLFVYTGLLVDYYHFAVAYLCPLSLFFIFHFNAHFGKNMPNNRLVPILCLTPSFR